ncbi:hypothetical protein DSECCO2_383210 [anaerobic digester metagenome]
MAWTSWELSTLATTLTTQVFPVSSLIWSSNHLSLARSWSTVSPEGPKSTWWVWTLTSASASPCAWSLRSLIQVALRASRASSCFLRLSRSLVHVANGDRSPLASAMSDRTVTVICSMLWVRFLLKAVPIFSMKLTSPVNAGELESSRKEFLRRSALAWAVSAVACQPSPKRSSCVASLGMNSVETTSPFSIIFWKAAVVTPRASAPILSAPGIRSANCCRYSSACTVPLDSICSRASSAPATSWEEPPTLVRAAVTASKVRCWLAVDRPTASAAAANFL